MPERSDIEQLVVESVRALAEDFEIDALKTPALNSPLYGNEGALDSMALVNLVADLEETIAAKYNTPITLADEKAMSSKHSPFRSVGSLTDAIIERLAS